MKKEFCCKLYEDEYKRIHSDIKYWSKTCKEEVIRQHHVQLLAPRSEIIFRDKDNKLQFKYIILNRRIASGYDFYCTKDKKNYFLKDSDFIEKVKEVEEKENYYCQFNYFPRKKSESERLLLQQQYDLLDTDDKSDNELVDIQLSKEAMYIFCRFFDKKISHDACKSKNRYKELINGLVKDLKDLGR